MIFRLCEPRLLAPYITYINICTAFTQYCFQFIPGADLLLKGTNPDFDSYSLFFDNGDNGALGSTGLDISLASKGVKTG